MNPLFLQLLLGTPALALDAWVVLPAHELPKDDPVERPEQPRVRSAVAWARTTLEPRAGHVYVEQELRIDPVQPSWAVVRVLDGRVRLDDSSDEVHQGPDGNWWFTGWVEGPMTIRVRGTILAPATELSLQVTSATRQEVAWRAPGQDTEVLGAVAADGISVLPPTDRLEASWRPHREPPPEADVVQATVATAAWIDEDALRMRSQVRFLVRRGQKQRFEVQLPAGVQELDASVSAGSWRREGNRVVVETEDAVEGALELNLDWRQTFSKGAAQVQGPRPQGVTSSTSSLTLAGSTEMLLSPRAQGGLRPEVLSKLPASARALGDAPPTAAWVGEGSLDLRALQLTALDGPSLVVDRSRCVQATNAQGRSLLRCTMDVRNASEQYLRFVAPEGTELWAARVNGEGVGAVELEQSMAIPLERSVETLAGLTTLDVELTFVGEHQAWERKGTRSLELPAILAPVARLEWELRLPPGFSGKLEGGTAGELGQASTEIVYAVTGDQDKSEEDRRSESAARETWNMALQAYQDNDFDTAQGYIDQTLQLDDSNENALRLQTNLDVLSGDDGGSSYASAEEEAMSRRVKDMARAKVAEEEVAQQDKLQDAERLLKSGDYEGAVAAYEELVELSDELSRYEQDESKQQDYYRSSSSSGLAEAKKKSAQRGRVVGGYGSASNSRSTGSTGSSGPSTGKKESKVDREDLGGMDEEFAFDFSGVEISGELVQPQGVVVDGLSHEATYGLGGAGIVTTHREVEQPPMVLEEPTPMPEPEPQPVTEITSAEMALQEVQAQVVAGDIVQSREYAAEVMLEVESYDIDDDFEDWDEFDELSPATATVQSAPGVAFGAGGVGLVDLGRDALDARESRASERRGGRAQPAASEPPPPPMGGAKNQAPAQDARNNAMPARPALAATTLALPLPDHGQSLVVAQRLLREGEAPTLEITYREDR